MCNSFAGRSRDVLTVDFDDEVAFLDASLFCRGGAVNTANLGGKFSNKGEAKAVLAFRNGDLWSKEEIY